MSDIKIGQPSEPGEYDAGMLALLQIIWGDGFLSPGGPDEVARLLEGSDIGDCEVLDIGCGLGAIDELLVTQYGARSVVGIDIDPSLLTDMQRRIERAGLASRIRGQKVEVGPLPFAAASFDVVFSKDSMVQIPDKPSIYTEVLRVLRPGGRFVASDWLRAAGFVDVEIRDRHDWYLALARRELEAMRGVLNALIVSRIGTQRAQHFIDNWRQLALVLERGELRPGHLKATKPA
jgi:SAM-dependent methyltransferase